MRQRYFNQVLARPAVGWYPSMSLAFIVFSIRDMYLQKARSEEKSRNSSDKGELSPVSYEVGNTR